MEEAPPVDGPVGKTARRQKRAFSSEEDAKLIQLVHQMGEHAWHDIEQLMPGRSSRQCRERWNLYLSPDIANDPWTPEEDMQLIRLYQVVGPKWTIIARQFTKRTANNVKNRQKQIQRRMQKLNRYKGQEMGINEPMALPFDPSQLVKMPQPGMPEDLVKIPLAQPVAEELPVAPMGEEGKQDPTA